MIPDHLRCQATAVSTGTRCRRQAALGTDLCEKHAAYVVQGEVAQITGAAPEVVRSELVQVMGAMGVDIADDSHLEPVEVMRWVVLKTHAIAEPLTTLLAAQDFAVRDSWPLIRQTLDALEALRKSAEAAESAGMQRRRVAVEEAKIQRVYLALDDAISRTELTPAVEKRLRENIGASFHALGSVA